MNHLSGECPVCKKPFAGGDDIVICPSCGAPYHRACYSEKGECVFAGRHAEGFEYVDPSQKVPPKEENGAAESEQNTPPKREGGILCKNCGTVNDASGIFCENCGAPLHAPAQAGGPRPFGGAGGFGGYYGPGAGRNYAGPGGTQTGAAEIDGIPARDWAEFIGTSAPNYLYRMSVMERRRAKISFTLSAFFVSPFYFAYRKMWVWALVALGTTLLFFLPQVFWYMAYIGQPLVQWLSVDFLYTLTIVVSYLSIAVQALFGLFALYLYKRDAKHKIEALRRQHGEGEEYHTAVRKKGGVSILAVVAVVTIIFLFSSWIMNITNGQIMDFLYPYMG